MAALVAAVPHEPNDPLAFVDCATGADDSRPVGLLKLPKNHRRGVLGVP